MKQALINLTESYRMILFMTENFGLDEIIGFDEDAYNQIYDGFIRIEDQVSPRFLQRAICSVS